MTPTNQWHFEPLTPEKSALLPIEHRVGTNFAEAGALVAGMKSKS